MFSLKTFWAGLLVSFLLTFLTYFACVPAHARASQWSSPEINYSSDTVEISIKLKNIESDTPRLREAKTRARRNLAEELGASAASLELVPLQHRQEIIRQFDGASEAINWFFVLDRSRLEKLEKLYEQHSEELEDIRLRLRNLERGLRQLLGEETGAGIIEKFQFGLDRIRKLISRDKIKQAKKELAGLEYFWLALESFSKGDYAKAHDQLLEGQEQAEELVDQYLPVILEKIRESGGRIFDYLPAVEMKFDTPAER